MTDFSVLMATYHADKAEYLKEALNSLVQQTQQPSEVVIVVDGEIPRENRELIDEFSNYLPIIVVTLLSNAGLGKALRIGLNTCRHSLVARFDADDICEPNRFEVQLDCMESHPSVDICGSGATLINALGVPTGQLHRPEGNNAIKRIIWSCPIVHPSVMFRKERILEIGNYRDLPLKRQEDYELWIRAAHAGLNFCNIPQKLIRYRRSAQTVKSRCSFMIGLGRLWYGFPAWLTFDRRLVSLLALIYPTIRPLLPMFLNTYFFRYDPRA